MSKKNQFTLRIDTDNADFEDADSALQAIFEHCLRKISMGKLSGKLMDRNGNTVGEYVWVK